MIENCMEAKQMSFQKEVMLLADEKASKQILELKENGDLQGKILKVSDASKIKEEFSDYSENHKLTILRSRNIDWNDLYLAAYMGWISPEAVTDEVKQKLRKKSGSYDNHHSKDKKSTRWTDYGMENLDQKNQEKPSLI